ncbi:MAG: hypothetical protein SGJ09_06105 [Phycisphaerae bacterium]|nr:hypothetical protein [Phycisphaerae bacterium]
MHDLEDDAELAHWRTRLARWRRFAPLVGFVLLAGAVVLVATGDTLGRALWALRHAPLTTVGLLLMSVLLSVGLTGSVFWVLTRRYGQVPFGEMQALMASTTLANYLPLRPGLFARLAYHKTRHRIRARDGLRTVFEAIGLSALSLALAIPALAIGVKLELPLGVVLTAPALLGVVGLAWQRTRLLSVAWLLRYAETLLTALRYHLAFGLAGTPVPAETSVAIACVSMAASLVPFVSNGIGLREWAIGLLAPVLTGYAVEQGIVAELVNRAAEIAIVIPTGLIGAAVLWRSSRQPMTDC